MRRVALLVLLSCPAGLWAGQIPDALVVLEVFPPALPGQAWEAAPPRFVLMEDGTVFVGGTGHVAAGRMERDEMKEIDKQVSRVRKLPGLGSSVTLGPGATRYRLVLRKGPEIAAAGDLAQAPASLKPLAALLETLVGFDHPSLRHYRPAQYALAARQAPIVGGCRSWVFGAPPEGASVSRTVSAEAAADWPTGAASASVCVGDKTYLVTLRPLLPGERP